MKGIVRRKKRKVCRDMANFCKYCGKALQDGEICSCPQAQAEAAQQYQGQQPQQPPQGYQLPQGYQQPPQDYQQPPQGYQPQQPPQGYQQPPQGYQPQQPPQGYQQPPQGYQPQQPPQGYQQPPQGYQPQQPAAPNPFVTALQKILPYLKSYVSSPVIAAQDFIDQKDLIFAGILIGIQAIVSGLALFGILQGLCNAVNGVAGILGAKMGASIPMSLIFGILAGVLAMAIFIVIVFAVAKICGSGCTFVDAVLAAVSHTPFVIVLLLASFLLFLLFLPLGAILFLTAMLSWIVLAIPTAQALIPNASQGKFWICIIVSVTLALLIGTWAATSLGAAAAGYMTVNGKTFNELGRDFLSLIDMF